MNRGTATKRSHRPRLRIGDVAERAGVNTQTLRYYERRGILGEPKRSASGYREYPSDTVRLIRFIKRAQELGFTLNEIEELITLRQTTPKRRAKVRDLAAAKLKDIDEKLARLQAMRSALYTLVEDCACGAETLTCPILEALDDLADKEVPHAD
ncbi:MAG: MerR family transcriptional regulator [Deltaproteobacteria bacterium]|nr:MerR family transcriptional regulator [Deltaproteobacteria bacterium]